MKNQEFITNSFGETQKLGENFILQSRILHRKIKGSIIIALYGDLGSGKTTFVQGIARGLGIKRRIISPTFIIVRQYQTRLPIYSSSRQCHPGVAATTIGSRDSIASLQNDSSRQARTINFYHIDLYRTESLEDIKGLGIEEIINDPQNIVVIEWAEKMGGLLPKHRVDIYFEYLGEERRKIKMLMKCE